MSQPSQSLNWRTTVTVWTRDGVAEDEIKTDISNYFSKQGVEDLTVERTESSDTEFSVKFPDRFLEQLDNLPKVRQDLKNAIRGATGISIVHKRVQVHQHGSSERGEWLLRQAKKVHSLLRRGSRRSNED